MNSPANRPDSDIGGADQRQLAVRSSVSGTVAPDGRTLTDWPAACSGAPRSAEITPHP